MTYSRNIFIYLEPRQQDAPEMYAQCETCRMFVPPTGCIIHGTAVKVDGDDTCSFYVPWPKGTPVPEVVADHRRELNNGIAASVTPEESGLVDELVQCHRCYHYSSGDCGLYVELNHLRPDMFELDVKVEAHGCCNAWTDEAPKQKSLLG